MKSIIKSIILFIVILSFTGILEASPGTTTQDFESIKLRHGYTYNFYDVINTKSKHVFVSDFNGSTFSERNGDYNGSNNPMFDFTSSFISNGKQVSPNTSKKIFESKSPYSINYHPKIRKKDNLFIKYQMQYYTWEGSVWSGVKTHIENQPYEITWCGDGIKDDYIDKYSLNKIYEQCDPNDSNKSGWGIGGCSNSCEPIVSQPVCNSLSYNTTKNPIEIGVDDTKKSIICKATNATTVKIDCGNGEIQSFLGNKNGTILISKLCSYTKAGTYTPKCIVNDTITNNVCKKSLTVVDFSKPAIEIIKSDFNTSDQDGFIGNDTQTVIKGNKAIFKITVKNLGGQDLKNIVITDIVEPSCNRTSIQTKAIYGGNVFLKGSSFSYICEKLDNQVNYTNTASVVGEGVINGEGVNDIDSTKIIIDGGGGGGGGSSVQCYNIKKSGNEYTCTTNSVVNRVVISCFNNTVTDSKKPVRNFITGLYEATFTCNPKDNGDGTFTQPTPKCGVTRALSWNIGEPIGIVNPQCSYRDPLCGNGLVDEGEQCDLGSSKNGIDSACSSTCKLNSRKNSFTQNCGNSFSYYNANKEQCDLTSTLPTGGELEITSVSNFAIGNNMRVFKDISSGYYEFNTDNILNNKALYIKNVGNTLMYYNDKLCLFDRGNKGKIKYTDTNFNGSDRSIISGDNQFCNKHPIGYIAPGEIKYLDPSNIEYNKDLLDMKGDILNFGNSKIKTSHLVLTVKETDGTTYDWSPILAGQIFVTVAKPTISSQGGGKTYLSNSIANINKIAKKVRDNGNTNNIDTNINTNQNNFTSTVLGNEINLSNIETVKDDNLIIYAKNDSIKIEKQANIIIENSINLRTTGDISNFSSYKGIKNVHFVKDTNIILGAKDFTENITYIIENGDLVIEGNIISFKNIAFIVKNGNIIIKNNVTRIDGTYINIGGEIKGEKTVEQLIINGSIYGDLNNLRSNRTHISMDSDGNINVGTIISYGSNLFNKPAPLVGQFISEYIESKKIAQ